MTELEKCNTGLMYHTMFIDIHTHAYRIKPPIISFSTPEELLKRYDEMKVDVAVLLPIVSPEIYLPQASFLKH